MSSRLRELIRAVRACKTAAEERSVISRESAALRQAFKDQDTLYRHRNVAKLMFIHMLGYPTHFGQMETLKLIAATGFPEKRIGYLGLMILLDERHEVLMLVTNSLKNDLNSKNQFSVGLALTALGNICSVEMARDLAPELEKLLSANNSYVRKKAALCCTRVIRKVPEALEGFQARAHSLLKDRHHSVMLTGVILVLEMCNIEPALIPVFREEVPLLVKILRTLLTSPFLPEYDCSGITDPFLQVKVLQLLKVLGHDHPESSDLMSDVLAQIATNTESTRNAGNAILYETVQTIMSTENTGGLRVLAINILGRFLANKDNNIRYVALNTLAKVVNVETQAVQRHRQTIVDCVKDTDVSIRRRALDLVYALVNQGNIQPLTKELLEYLHVSDVEFKPDLVAKICQLVQQFAPNKRWHFDSILQALVEAGDHAKEEVFRTLVVLISNEPSLQAYAARQSYRALSKDLDKSCLLLTSLTAWFLGEYGDQVLSGSSKQLEGEEAGSMSGREIVLLLGNALAKSSANPIASEYLLTALMKLATRVPDQSHDIKAMISKHTNSINLEIQSRSCEYDKLFKFAKMRDQLMEAMPALDEKTYNARFSAPAIVATGPSLTGTAKEAGQTVTAELGDLLALDDDAPPATVAHPAEANNYLHDLLADVPPSSAPAAVSSNSFMDVMDLLGSADQGSTLQATAAHAAPKQQSDPFAELTSTLQEPAANQSYPRTRVYDKDNVIIDFNFAKPAGQPAVTEITAYCSTSSQQPLASFGLQAAVPKYMHLKLEAASGNILQAEGPEIRQRLRITNNQHGMKAMALRLRISYNRAGEAKTDMVEVKNLPAGL